MAPLMEVEPAKDAPLAEPFHGKPSDALKAGYCPSCRGTGRVVCVVPYSDTFPCSTCHGSGTWPPSNPTDKIGWWLPDGAHEWPGGEDLD